MKENNSKLEELRKVIEKQNSEHNIQTYASVTSNTSIKPHSEKTTMHTIIVDSEDVDDTGELVLDKIRDTIDAKEGWVKVERIRKARDRKIIMSVGSREERSRIKDRLEKSGKRLICEEVNNKDPLLILLNVLMS